MSKGPTRIEHLPPSERPKGYDLKDPRLHPCMVHHIHIKYQGDYPVHPHPQISGRLADLIAGDHDLTLMDATARETMHGGPFYEHCHYLASLACAIDAMNALGAIEHSSDWDWYLGMVLRDGTRIGDGSFVYGFEDDKPHTDEEYREEERKEEGNGYCDTFHVPTFDEIRPNHVSCSDWFANMPVVLDLWHTSTNPEGKNDLTVCVKDVALVHFMER